MPHVINSNALTGEKPCINKAIHALLMHGYATFNMPVPGPHNCCRHEMCIARPLNEHSTWKLRSRDIGEKAKQKSARNNAKCSKRFQFLCNKSHRTWFFNALTFSRSLGRCWKPRPSVSVFNTSHGTWRMLMHEKPCLIPILLLKMRHTIVAQNRVKFIASISETLFSLWIISQIVHLVSKPG